MIILRMRLRKDDKSEVNVLNVDEEIDLENSIWFIEMKKGTLISVQRWAPFVVAVATPKTPFTVMRASPGVYNPHGGPIEL